jgi:hypothetical protein
MTGAGLFGPWFDHTFRARLLDELVDEESAPAGELAIKGFSPMLCRGPIANVRDLAVDPKTCDGASR